MLQAYSDCPCIADNSLRLSASFLKCIAFLHYVKVYTNVLPRHAPPTRTEYTYTRQKYDAYYVAHHRNTKGPGGRPYRASVRASRYPSTPVIAAPSKTGVTSPPRYNYKQHYCGPHHKDGGRCLRRLKVTWACRQGVCGRAGRRTGRNDKLHFHTKRNASRDHGARVCSRRYIYLLCVASEHAACARIRAKERRRVSLTPISAGAACFA